MYSFYSLFFRMAALENHLLRWQLSYLIPFFFFFFFFFFPIIELTADHAFELSPLVSLTQQPAYTRIFSLCLLDSH